MILTLDVSNSNIIFGGLTEGKAEFICRLSSSGARTADEYAVLLRLVARHRGFDLGRIQGAIMSSVVPPLTPVIMEAVKAASGHTPMLVGPGIRTGLNIRIDDPNALGGDFVASAVAALSDYPLPCVTIDMSTATSIGVLDKRGNYIGGAICPGILVSQRALTSVTSQLPKVSIEVPSNIIGRDTAESMRTGLVFGAAAMLEGLLDRIEEELGDPISVVATGDWAPLITPLCRRHQIVVDETLLMRGLWMIYHKNVKK